MKPSPSAIILSFAALIASAAARTPITSESPEQILFPTAAPAGPDGAACSSASDYTSLFHGTPAPTPSELSSALRSYENRLVGRSCLFQGLVTSGDCRFPPASRWCDFTAAGGVSDRAVLSQFGEYVSSASKWWAASSSVLVDAAAGCPAAWWEVGWEGTQLQGLNRTVGFASCGRVDVDAAVTGGGGSRTMGTALWGTPTTGGSPGGAGTPTPTGQTSGAAARMGMGCWVVVGVVAAVWLEVI